MTRRVDPFPDDDNEEVEIAADLVTSTPKAYLINDGTQDVWVPKSLVTNNDDGTFTMPMWIARKRGLI